MATLGAHACYETDLGFDIAMRPSITDNNDSFKEANGWLMAEGVSDVASDIQQVSDINDHTDDENANAGRGGKHTWHARVLMHKTSQLAYNYSLGPTLGQGSSGVVRMAEHVESGKLFACKTVFTDRLERQMAVAELKAEIDAMKRVTGHANVVELHGLYEEADALHIVMDLCSGGDLYDYFTKNPDLSETELAFIFWQSAQAIRHCHAQGIVHRDVKPENLLVAQMVRDGTRIRRPVVKLTDFGQALRLNPGEKASGLAGSPTYVAPEILRGLPYGTEVDMWSLGVTLFAALSGRMPFPRMPTEELLANAPITEPEYPDFAWDNVSPEAKDLCQSVLQVNPFMRASAEQFLQHPWILKYAPVEEKKKPARPMRNRHVRTSSDSLPPEVFLPSSKVADWILPPPEGAKAGAPMQPRARASSAARPLTPDMPSMMLHGFDVQRSEDHGKQRSGESIEDPVGRRLSVAPLSSDPPEENEATVSPFVTPNSPYSSYFSTEEHDADVTPDVITDAIADVMLDAPAQVAVRQSSTESFDSPLRRFANSRASINEPGGASIRAPSPLGLGSAQSGPSARKRLTSLLVPSFAPLMGQGKPSGELVPRNWNGEGASSPSPSGGASPSGSPRFTSAKPPPSPRPFTNSFLRPFVRGNRGAKQPHRFAQSKNNPSARPNLPYLGPSIVASSA
eukprot:TRINITY_DN4861_c0_g1_i1.p1 TRINITY_DN4861_c0_g1~~TRINITY_DN4861_c0_g1_i1.p1  ORF type:complete len:682 (+),score=69.52 TRINITY_DN4861_c0_g1_i1:370-2415(+)